MHLLKCTHHPLQGRRIGLSQPMNNLNMQSRRTLCQLHGTKEKQGRFTLHRDKFNNARTENRHRMQFRRHSMQFSVRKGPLPYHAFCLHSPEGPSRNNRTSVIKDVPPSLNCTSNRVQHSDERPYRLQYVYLTRNTCSNP